MIISFLKKSNNITNENVIDISDHDIFLLPYNERDIFDILRFDYYGDDYLKVDVNNINFFPYQNEEKKFAFLSLVSSFFKLGIVFYFDFEKTDERENQRNELMQKIKEFRYISHKTDEEKKNKLHNVLNLIKEYQPLYILCNLNNSYNRANIDLLKNEILNNDIPFIVLDEKPLEDDDEETQKTSKKEENKDLKNGSSKKEKNNKNNDSSFKNVFEYIKYLFNDLYKKHWDSFLFLFLQTFLFSTLFLLCVPLIINKTNLGIGITFGVIGLLCFLLAIVIQFDLSNSLLKKHNKKDGIMIEVLAFLLIACSAILGGTVFYFLAKNELLVKLSEYSFKYAIISIGSCGFLLLSCFLFIPFGTLAGKIENYIKNKKNNKK